VIEKFVAAGEIIPLTSSSENRRSTAPVIKIYLNEKNLGLVTLGKTVQVRVDALPDKA